MKKTLKKIAATLSAAVLCAVPVMGSLTANAAVSSNVKTYRTYWNVKSTSTARTIGVEFYIAKPMKQAGREKYTGCNTGAYKDFHYGGGSTYGTLQFIRWKSNNGFKPGVLFKVVTEVDANCSKSFSQLMTKNNWNVYNSNDKEISNSCVDTMTVLIGDINNDGQVTYGDYGRLEAVINKTKVLTDTRSKNAADINGDGVVNRTDLNYFSDYFDGYVTIAGIQAG